LGAVIVELLVAVVVEPVFFGLITSDPGMSDCFGVGGGVADRASCRSTRCGHTARTGAGETTIRAVVRTPRSLSR
jgi:hypothetical protein